MSIRATIIPILLLVLPGYNAVRADVLDDITRRLNSNGEVTGRFVQYKHIPSIDRALESNGKFIYSRIAGITWEVLQPFPSSIIIDSGGSTIVDGKRVAGTGQALIMLDIFNSLSNNESRPITANFLISGEVDDNGWRLVLKPKSSPLAKYIRRVTLIGDDVVRSIYINESNNAITTIDFSEIHPLQPEQGHVVNDETPVN